MTWVGNFFRQQATEDDANSVYCPVRVFGMGGAGAFVLCQGWHTVATAAFDAKDFGFGFAAVIAALGSAIGIKRSMGAG